MLWDNFDSTLKTYRGMRPDIPAIRNRTASRLDVYCLGRRVCDIHRHIYRTLKNQHETARLIAYHVETIKSIRKNPYRRMDGFVFCTREECVEAFYLMPHFYWSTPKESVCVTLRGKIQGSFTRIAPDTEMKRWVYTVGCENGIFDLMQNARYRLIHDGVDDIVRTFWDNNRTIKPFPDKTLASLMQDNKPRPHII